MYIYHASIGGCCGAGPVDNPEEIELGEDDDLGEDDVPDDGDAVELEAQPIDSASALAEANGTDAGVNLAQRETAVPARTSLQASLAALQPAGASISQTLVPAQPATASTVNPEDINLPED